MHTLPECRNDCDIVQLYLCQNNTTKYFVFRNPDLYVNLEYKRELLIVIT